MTNKPTPFCNAMITLRGLLQAITKYFLDIAKLRERKLTPVFLAVKLLADNLGTNGSILIESEKVSKEELTAMSKTNFP